MYRLGTIYLTIYIMQEIWKPIKGYEELYEVSNLGNIKSLGRLRDSNGGNWQQSGRVLKFSINAQGYRQVILYKNHTRKTHKVQRLVATAFISNPLNKAQVNHINGVKDDNIVSNLEWCTNGENQIHAIKTGLKKVRVGSEAPAAILKDWQIRVIRGLYKMDKYTYQEIADFFLISKSSVSNIITNKSWTHIL